MEYAKFKWKVSEAVQYCPTAVVRSVQGDLSGNRVNRDFAP